MTVPPMRPQIEIQRLHNMLMDVLSDPPLARDIIPEEFIAPLLAVTDCLCWILHHDAIPDPCPHASRFATIVDLLRKDLADAGHVWEERGEYTIVEED